MTSPMSCSARETLWQCKLGFSTDKMVGDSKVLTARCRWNGTFSVPAECQNSDSCVGNRCGSHGVCREGDTNGRSFVIYECHVQCLQSQSRDGRGAEEKSAERHQGPDRESISQ